MPAAAESNGLAACQSPTTHAKKRLGTVSGERFATLGDLELALQAAVHVNQHLNREIEAVLNRLHKAEQERTAWQQRAQLLAKQLAKERRLRSSAGTETDLIPSGRHLITESSAESITTATDDFTAAAAAARNGGGGGASTTTSSSKVEQQQQQKGKKSSSSSQQQQQEGQVGADVTWDEKLVPCSGEEQQEAEQLLQQAAEGAGTPPAAAGGGGGGVEGGGDLFRLPQVQEPLQQLLSKGRDAGWLATRGEIHLGDVLGRGAFGTTHRANWRGADVAVKCVTIGNQAELMNFLREVECLAALRHPHVVPFLGACLQDQHHCWLISEFMSRGTLAAWVHEAQGPLGNNLPLVDRLQRALEVASALAALEASRPPILHRDVKPTNIFLDGSGAARLGDFGLARHMPSSRATLTGETGTYVYMSPEMIRHEIYDSKSDVWSFGVTLAELITGMTPYADLYLTPVQVAVGVSEEKLRPWLPGHLPPALLALATACCDYDPEMRPSFNLVVEELTGIVADMRQQQQQQPGGLLGRLMPQGSKIWGPVFSKVASAADGS